MTIYIADIASYQKDLPLSALASAGFTGINLKVSHGLGQKAVHSMISQYAAEAQRREWKLSTFHYLTGDAPGDAQARYAYGRMFALDLHGVGVVHVVDVEDTTVTESIFLNYVNTMGHLLERPFALYTGDWYERDREWTRCVPGVMPWLWAAPKIGYLTKYPGDKSEHWDANFSDAQSLAVMQYKVGIIGGVKVSQSAVRDENIWERMSGKMTFAPESLLAVRREFQKHTNLSNVALGIVRNERDTSYHVGKSWLKPGAYSVNESPRDRNPTEASSGIDIGYFEVTGSNGKKYTLRDYNRWLVNECKKGAKDTLDIREVIYSLDGKTVLRWDREDIRDGGDTSHTGHTHQSYYRDSEKKDRAAHVRRWFKDVVFKEDEMNAAEMTAWAKSEAGAAALGAAVFAAAFGKGDSRRTAGEVIAETRNGVLALVTAVAGIDQVDEGALAAALVPSLADAVLAGLPEGVLTAADVEQAVRNVLLSGAAPDVA